MRSAEEVAVVYCLQARRVTGLPVAVHQVHLGCQCHHHLGRASASVSGGVAEFRDQVLLLHCGGAAAVGSIAVDITVSVSSSPPCDHHHHRTHQQQQQQLRLAVGRELLPPTSESPCRVLSFVLGGVVAGAVLTLSLHHRVIRPPAGSNNSCMPLPLPLPLPACCRRNKTRRRQQQGYDGSDDESDGFIIIEKQGRRRPPPENLVAADDRDAIKKLELHVDGSRAEDEFLAMLELADADAEADDLDLDMLIKEAEAELASARAHLLKDGQDASMM